VRKAGIALALVLMAIAGCGDDDDGGTPEDATERDGGDGAFVAEDLTGAYAGTVEGSDISIGVSLDVPLETLDDNTPVATGFVTDGAEVGEYFVANFDRSSDSLTLTSADEDAELEIDLAADELTGQFVPEEGQAAAFEAERVEFPAGHYYGYGEVAGEPVHSGAVLLDDGTSRAAVLEGDEVVPATVGPETAEPGQIPPTEEQLEVVPEDGGYEWRVTWGD
jgi:hypothetical protein